MTKLTKVVGIIEVWQEKYRDMGGDYRGVYRTESEARTASDYSQDTPLRRNAVLLLDGKVWLLSKEGHLGFTNDILAEKDQALSKLTDREKEILGLKA